MKYLLLTVIAIVGYLLISAFISPQRPPVAVYDEKNDPACLYIHTAPGLRHCPKNTVYDGDWYQREETK